MGAFCRVELLGELRVEQGGRVITRFQTRKTGALLAYLAYHPARHHPREVLAELLWPWSAAPAGRRSLRVALTSLRRQLEPPGVPPGSILQANRFSVRLNAEAVSTDVGEFERMLEAAARARGEAESARHLQEAVDLYRGELLPGYYEDWVVSEQRRLADSYCQAVRSLVAWLERTGDLNQALSYARRAVSVDPLWEGAHLDLVRLLALAGEHGAALRQGRELERMMREDLRAELCPEARRILQRLESGRLGMRAAGEEGKPRGPTLRSAPSPAPHPTGPASDLQSLPAANGTGTCPGGDAAAPPAPSSTVPDTGDSAAPAPAVAGHVPPVFSRFFGREEEQARLQQALLAPETRLVTLVGAPGCGKTRLAVEVAQRLLGRLHGAVWFVPLQSVPRGALIADAIRDMMRLPRSAARDPLEQVTAALRAQPSLLVLDNVEHLADEGAAVVRALLEAVPSTTCLTTSRQLLRLEGEVALPVGPLPVPAAAAAPEELLSFASVQLFVDRAQAVRPDFQVTPRNAASIGQLCARLEGIPLALELAASRVQVLTPAQMVGELEHRFEFLATRRRDADERHRTLRGAVDWSFELLPPTLRRFYARLSVFRGGWTGDAAAAVCEEPRALDCLAELQERSLVVSDETVLEMRFRMLETLREYAEGQLGMEERAALCQRHAAHYAALAQEARPRLRGPGQAAWLERLDTEHSNLRAALAWCQAAPDGVQVGLRLAAALERFWQVRGHLAEGRAVVGSLLARDQAGPRSDVRAMALNAAGNLARQQGDYAAARGAFEESLASWRELGDPGAGALYSLGLVAENQGELAAARALFEESLALWRGPCTWVGKQPIALALNALGCIADRLEDHAGARAYFEESLAISREVGDLRHVAACLVNLVAVGLRQGAGAQVQPLLSESLRITLDLGDNEHAANVLAGFADLAQSQGRLERAIRLLGAAEAARQAVGAPAVSFDGEDKTALAAARVTLGDEAFAAAWVAGRGMALAEAGAYALEDLEDPACTYRLA